MFTALLGSAPRGTPAFLPALTDSLMSVYVRVQAREPKPPTGLQRHFSLVANRWGGSVNRSPQEKSAATLGAPHPRLRRRRVLPPSGRIAPVATPRSKRWNDGHSKWLGAGQAAACL